MFIIIPAGAVLYEATFGKAPFATDHLLHLIKKVSYEKIFWPSKKDGRPKITKFLQGLLEKDPKKRIVWHDILHHNCVGLLAAFKCYLPTRSRRISRLNQNFKWSNKIFKFCFRVKSSKHTTSHWHKSKELQELITSFIFQSFVRRKLNAWHFLLRKHPVISNNSEQNYTVHQCLSVLHETFERMLVSPKGCPHSKSSYFMLVFKNNYDQK